MALSFEVRRVGKVGVIRCIGQVIVGADSAALYRVVEDVLPHTRRVLLHMALVDFIDSSGLGLLIRLLRRAQTSRGRIALCSLAPNIVVILRKTRLDSIFEIHEREHEAIAALHRPTESDGGSFGFEYANVLCAAGSADILSYASELLRQAGYAVLTAANVPDAVTLLNVLARPKLVVATREFFEDPTLSRVLGTVSVLQLASEFSQASVGASAEALLAAVRGAIGAPAPANPPRASLI